MAETGVLLDYDTDLRTLIYLSDKVEDRVQKRRRAKELAEAKARRNTGR